MPRFKFKLQPVLDHRELIEQQRQKVVAELEAQRVGLERTITDLQRQLVSEQGAARERARVGDVAAVRQQGAAALRIRAEAQRAALQLAGVFTRLQAARQELLAATTARKAVEMLRDRQRDAWRQNEDRKEQAMLDEIAVMGATKSQETMA